ncbi:MAG: hypothetical protein WKF75_11675 [Singulisphaera sp.]
MSPLTNTPHPILRRLPKPFSCTRSDSSAVSPDTLIANPTILFSLIRITGGALPHVPGRAREEGKLAGHAEGGHLIPQARREGRGLDQAADRHAAGG